MTEAFYPTVPHEEHRRLKEEIKEVCRELSARCIDLVGYYNLPEEDRWLIARDFSHEALWVRTIPDLYIHPVKPPGFFLDVKTKASPKYQNIAIELSSFYWTLRRNMPDSRGITCLHFYAGRDLEGNIRVFSPLLVKNRRVIIPLYHWSKGQLVAWTNEEKRLFRHYAECIVSKPNQIQVKDVKGGSGDPFILIPQATLKGHMTLREFLQNDQARINYSRKRGTMMTDLLKWSA